MTAPALSWDEHQDWEAQWWGSCVNTFCEENKQISYAYRMGLVNEPRGEFWPSYDVRGARVLDLGGGPASMLLKAVNFTRATVVDPCDYPPWVRARYESHNVAYFQEAAETWDADITYDECWIYNVLQHVKDPGAVLATANYSAKLIRIFEWIDLPYCIGHPNTLSSETLDKQLFGKGTVEQMNGENGCWGRAYYGTFAT